MSKTVVTVLKWIWNEPVTPGSIVLIMSYAGTDLERLLTWRQRLVCWAVNKWCKNFAQEAWD